MPECLLQNEPDIVRYGKLSLQLDVDVRKSGGAAAPTHKHIKYTNIKIYKLIIT